MLNDCCGLLIINKDTCYFRKMQTSVNFLNTIPIPCPSKPENWFGGVAAIRIPLFVEDTSNPATQREDTDQSRWCLKGRSSHFRHQYGKMTRMPRLCQGT